MCQMVIIVVVLDRRNFQSDMIPFYKKIGRRFTICTTLEIIALLNEQIELARVKIMKTKNIGTKNLITHRNRGKGANRQKFETFIALLSLTNAGCTLFFR